MIDLMNYPPGNVFIAFDLINYSPGRVFITLLLVHNFHRLIPHFLQCASYLFVLKSITKGTFSMGIFFFINIFFGLELIIGSHPAGDGIQQLL